MKEFKIEQNGGHTNRSKASTVFGVIVISVIFLSIVSIIFFNAQEDSSIGSDLTGENALKELEAWHANRQPTIDRLAPEYCNTHQSKITTFEDPSYPSNDGSGWTQEECRSIVGLLYDGGSSVEDIENIINSRVWIGMRHIEVWYSLGNPDTVNTSNYGAGNTQQLVYGYNYIYLDSNGIVTSYQL